MPSCSRVCASTLTCEGSFGVFAELAAGIIRGAGTTARSLPLGAWSNQCKDTLWPQVVTRIQPVGRCRCLLRGFRACSAARASPNYIATAAPVGRLSGCSERRIAR